MCRRVDACMLIVIGGIIVLASTLGGFMIAGGKPLVLLHVSEFVVILGVAAGVLVIASPGHVLKEIIYKLKVAIGGKADGEKSSRCFTRSSWSAGATVSRRPNEPGAHC